MNGKTKNWTIGGLATLVITTGLVVGTIKDLKWWTWSWEHEALAEDVAEKRNQLAQNFALQHRQITEVVQTNEVEILRIKLDTKFNQRLSVAEARRQCESDPARNCVQLRRDEAKLLNAEKMLEKQIDRMLQK